MALQYLSRATKIEFAPGYACPMHWRSGLHFDVSLETPTDWSRLRVRDAASGVLLPVAYDNATSRPFTDPDWRVLVELSSPKPSYRSLARLFSVVDPLTAYPHSSGVCAGKSAVAALVGVTSLPLGQTMRLLSAIARRLPLSAVRAQGRRTLVELALLRQSPQGLVLAEWLHAQGVPSWHQDTCRDTALLAWSVAESLRPDQAPKPEQLATLLTDVTFRSFLSDRSLADTHEAPALQEVLASAWWTRLDPKAAMGKTITLTDIKTEKKTVYEGPLAGALLHWLRTRPASTNAASLVRNWVSSAPPLDLAHPIVWRGRPSCLGDLLSPLQLTSSERSPGPEWVRFCAAEHARALTATLPRVSASPQPRVRM